MSAVCGWYSKEGFDDEITTFLSNQMTREYAYLVRIAQKIIYKYDGHTEIEVENVLLMYDSENDSYVWENDWYEGADEVCLLGVISLDNIQFFGFPKYIGSERVKLTTNANTIRNLSDEGLAYYLFAIQSMRKSSPLDWLKWLREEDQK